MKNKLKLFSTTLLLTSQILFPMNGLAETSHEKNDAIANPGIFSETDQKTNKKEGGELSQDSQITAQETTTSSLETQESLSTLEKATIYSNDIVTGINGTSEWSFENGTLTFTGGALTQAISKMTEIDPQTITKINFAGPVTIPSLWSETSSFFANLSKLTGIDNGSNLDFSNISEPYYLFRNDTNLEYIDTSNWDTSSMIRTTGMFLGCTNLKTVDVSNWDTSNVVDLGNMFSGCRSIDNLDVSNWDTSKVTNLDKTFYNTNNLSSLDVSNWDTSNVTNMSQLFAGSALSVLDLSNWNTLKNTHAERMLYLPNLKQLALGKNVILTSSYGNASIAPLSATDEYTGYWQTVGPGSIEKPLGDIVIDSQTLSATYDGSSMSGLYVWQPVTLLGSDYTMYLGDSTPTVADFNASATDKNGTPIQVKADFSNVDFSKVGTYDVILSSADGQTKTVTLTIKENKQSISGSNFSMYVGDKTPTVSDFKATATDKDGKELEVTADFSKVDFSKAGTYEVTLQTTDGQTKTVKLVIKENKQSISGSDFSMYVGDKTPTVSDFKATATDKDGKELEVTADFSKVDFSKAGTYEVTLQTTDGQTKTVKLVIKENKQSISGSDFSMYVGDKTPTVSDFKATATDKDGKELEVTADFSKVDFSKAGTYEVTLQTTDGQTKTVKLVIKEKNKAINQNIDKNNHSSRQSKQANNFKANLPSTGEQKSNLFYVIGTILILLALAVFGGLKKYRRRN